MQLVLNRPEEQELAMRTLTEQGESFAEIQGYLVERTLDLFQGHGLQVGYAVGAPAVDSRGPFVMATIGYAATTMRGALLLLTSQAVVAALQPIETDHEEPTEALLRDVLGEFATCSSAA